MARNRVIYQSEGVYVSQNVNSSGVLTGDYDACALYGVQNASYSLSIARQDVNQFGQLAAVDRIITETPTVSLDTSYYVSNLGNEHKLGFHIWADPSNVPATPVSCISGIINSEANDGVKNYYILTTKEGSDLVNNTESGKYESIIGIGNASITSYSTEAAVGGIPTASISAEGQNMNFVNTPYTGAYDGVTGFGLGNGVDADLEWNQKGVGNGAGFEPVGQVVFTVTGAPTTDSYTATDGAVQTVQIQSGTYNLATPSYSLFTRTGIGATLPVGSVFTSQDGAAGTAITLTLESEVTKGDREIYAKLGGAGFAAFNSGKAFTGTFNDVISYISGSNPAINSSDGELNQWRPVMETTSLAGNRVFSGGMPLDVRNTAPIKLPVAQGKLTSNSTNVTGAVSVIRPGDITISLKKATDGSDPTDIPGIIINEAPIQSYNISFDLSRSPLQKLGTKFAYARPVDFPITSSFSFDAMVTDLTTGTVVGIVDCDEEYNATIKLKNKDCGANEYIMSYELKGLKIDDQSYSTSLGDNKTVSYSFSSQVGGPDQSDVGVFMSGYYKDNTVPTYS